MILKHMKWESVLPGKKQKIHQMHVRKTSTDKEKCYNAINWTPSLHGLQLKICGDAKCVVDWANGVAATKDSAHLANVHAARNALAHLWGKYNVHPAPATGNWVQHQYRKYNGLADKLATKAIVENTSKWVQRPIPPNTIASQASFDGCLRKGRAGTGW